MAYMYTCCKHETQNNTKPSFIIKHRNSSLLILNSNDGPKSLGYVQADNTTDNH